MSCPAGCVNEAAVKEWYDAISKFIDSSEESIIKHVEAQITECEGTCGGSSDRGCMLKCVDTWRPVAAGFEECLSVFQGLPDVFNVPPKRFNFVNRAMTKEKRNWAIAGGVVAVLAVLGGVYYVRKH